jgi:hypothetical protein
VNVSRRGFLAIFGIVKVVPATVKRVSSLAELSVALRNVDITDAKYWKAGQCG